MSDFRFDKGPAPEVLRFFEEKRLQPSFDWRDVWAEEHAVAFTVAKTTGFDVLEDIREELNAALREGLPFAEFKKRLEPRLRAKGWWGRREVIDPKTGEVVRAQLGSRRRLRTIYQANVRTARAAGQWERAQRTKRMLPYFEYRLGPSRKHRQQHVSWALAPTILPVDDPFWDTHYPPNGWGCKCWLRQISKREAARLGGPTEPPPITWREYHNPRDGRTYRIPDGIDPGWQTNPGKARARLTMGRFFERLERDGGAAAEAAMQDFWRSGVWRAWMYMRERVHMPVAILPAAAAALQARSPMISISSDTLASKVRKHTNPETHPPDTWEWFMKALEQLPALLAQGIWLGEMQPGRVWVIIYVDGKPLRVIIGKAANGYLHVKSIHPVDDERVERWLKRAKK